MDAPTESFDAIRGSTVSGLLRSVARRAPRHEAVISPERGVRWSFAELDRRADEVAAALIARGFVPGDRAVVWAANLPEWIALQYGLARAGVVLVTANTSLKLEEIAYILKKSGARALFFGRGGKGTSFPPTVAALDRSALPSLRLLVGIDGARAADSIDFADFLATATDASRAEVPRREAALDPRAVINMQYTSGTTGFPKGVMLSHSNLVENSIAIAPSFHHRPGDRLCLAVPLFHCFGCVIGTLVAHASCIAIVLNDVFDADAILDTIERERCTTLYGVPTMFIAELEAQRRRPRDLSSLRVGVMAGAFCPEKLMREAARELSIPGLVIAYGLTEASPGVTLSRPEDSIDVRATTVGRALPGVEIKIVCPKRLVPLPAGTRGELWTRGPHIMQGYDGEEAATRAAVTPDGWLRSGDLAEELPDGYFRIVGRIKELIIRGGENISPAEIEDTLRRHPAVLDAAAFGVPSEFFGEEVVAAVRTRPGVATTAEELREFVRSHIADHKVPARIEFVDAFPLTGSGKVQKFKLRERFTAPETRR